MYRTSLFTRISAVAFLLVFVLSSVQPAFAAAPANDDFANATVMSPIPFSDTFDLSEATNAPGETVCGSPTDFAYHSVWYTFTPATAQSYKIDFSDFTAYTQVNLYSGNTYGALTCLGGIGSSFGGYFTRLVDAGTTYYVQVSTDDPSVFGKGTVKLDLTPVDVSFNYTPADPSVFDTVQFTSYVYANLHYPPTVGEDVTSYQWDFGDGAVSADQNPAHKFASDGDYTVTLTATTTDNRTGLFSRVIQVRTHDVAVSKLTAPQTGRVGKSTTLTAYVASKRAGETVKVSLYKSDPSAADGWSLVGAYSQFVPLKTGSKTTTAFSFNYTFTSSDLVVGKVSFKAVAEIQGLRDAIPSDNTLISSPPTRVSK